MPRFGIIPKPRLEAIPSHLRAAHEYCYHLHDECARMIVEYEAAEAGFISIQFKTKKEAQEFLRATKKDPIRGARALGYTSEARQIVLNQVTMALVSDFCMHIFEALRCLEKRKIVVAFNLLRKPLKDNLVYLTWIAAQPDEFYTSFSTQSPESITPARLGARRAGLFDDAIRQCGLEEVLTADLLCKLLFDRANTKGLEPLFQHAVHLVTVKYAELRTKEENFNFIFKNPLDDDVYEQAYRVLPPILLYALHVVCLLFERIKPMEQGAKKATLSRAMIAFTLLQSETIPTAQKVLADVFEDEIKCEHCDAPIQVTPANAFRIALAESFRCVSCKRTNHLPFSWLFG